MDASWVMLDRFILVLNGVFGDRGLIWYGMNYRFIEKKDDFVVQI